jgi:hypothetical protein
MAENKAIAVSTRKQVLAVGAMGADAFILIVASTATEEYGLSLNVGLINLRWHSSRSLGFQSNKSVWRRASADKPRWDSIPAGGARNSRKVGPRRRGLRRRVQTTGCSKEPERTSWPAGSIRSFRSDKIC